MGQFELREVLGRGGMATVHRGEHVSGIGLQAAVKILHPHLMIDREVRARMRLEAQTLARLQHPCVVRLLDFVELAPGYALVTEYVEGKTLDARMREDGGAPMERMEALRIFGQILDGVAHAHEEGCLHRDIKPANVMVGRKGRVKVLDFGIASLLEGGSAVAGDVVGTPSYMAPEQLLGEVALDERADLYSLGVVLWELMAGLAARRRSRGAAWRLQPQDIDQLRDDGLPDTLLDLIRDLTAEDVADRLPDVPAAAARLDAIVAEGLPVDAVLTVLGPGPARAGVPGETLWMTREQSGSETTRQTQQATTRLWAPTRLPSGLGTQLTGTGAGADAMPTVRGATNLPAVSGAFVGRAEELRAIVQKFEDGAPIVTLLGAAGTGKSRLATEYGRAAQASYPGGVWRVELAEANGVDALCGAVSRVFDVPLGRTPIDQLGNVICGRGRVLILLDTFEHLVQHAFQTVGTWSVRAPDARFLVTSRIAFDLAGAETVSVLPLSPPALPGLGGEGWREDLLRDPAIDLFLRRARTAHPSIEFDDPALRDVAAIVDRLDGLPLAIELAAAWVATLSPAEIRQRLAERFDLLEASPRTATGRSRSSLRGAFDGSWELLERDERVALAQCSVFAGGFDEEAAEGVLDLSGVGSNGGAAAVVRSLVDKSLLHTDHAARPRFWLLESVRVHAAEQLGAMEPGESKGGADGVRRRHGAWFARWGDLASLDALDLSGGVELRARLAADLGNLGAAIRNSLSDGVLGTAAAAARAVLATCRLRGPFVEGLAIADAVLAAPRLEPVWRCRLLADRGWLRRLAGRSDEALADLDEARTLASRCGEDRVVVEAQTARGIALRERGDMWVAQVAFDEALALCRRLGLRAIEGRVLGSMAILSKQNGEFGEAEVRYEAALAIHRDVGNRRSEGVQLGELALLRLEQGRVGLAAEGWEAALAILRETGHRRGEAQALGNLGLLCRNEERMEDAARFLAAGIALQRQVGNRRSEAVQLGNLGDLYLAVDMFDDARECLDDALLICRETSFRLGEGAFSGSRAELAARTGDFANARAYLATGEVLLRELGNKAELGKLLCRKGRMDAARGDLRAASDSLLEAETLARELGTGPRAELSQALESFRKALASARPPGT